MNEISKNPLILEINQDLDVRIKAFSAKWGQGYKPDAFKKILVTLRSSAILQITSKVNAALTAKKNGDNIDSFLKDLEHFLVPDFSPDIKGTTIEKGRFNGRIRLDALELLKGFSVFVGNRATAYFGTPSEFKATDEIHNDTPNGQGEVIDTHQNISPEILEKRLADISLDIQKKGTETELSNYIKTVLQREKLAIDNVISRAKRTVSEEIFHAQCSHLISFSVSLNELILAAKNKLNHIQTSPVRAASMSRVDNPLKDDRQIPYNSIETAGIKTGIEQRPSLPTRPDEKQQRPKEEEKILKDIQEITESENIRDLKNYRTRSLLKPLSSLMKHGKTKSGDKTSQQRKDFLAEQLFHVDDMIKRMEAKKMIPAHKHLDPAPKMTKFDGTNDPSNDADKHLPTEPSKATPTFRRRILAIGATAAAAVAAIASIGLGMLNIDTQAKAGNQTVQKPIAASFNAVAFVEERENRVNIEKINHDTASAPELGSPPLTLKQKRIKYNFRKIVNNYDIKPAVIGEFQMKRVTENTLENLCKMYKNPTWVCLSNQSPT